VIVRPRARRTLATVGIAMCVLGLTTRAALAQAAQVPSPADLAEASLEDLMNIKVTSVSRKEQSLSKVAAAIFVIGQEDIRRSGATTIPDLLRMVPGMDVGQINGSTWAISARGFNGQWSNKLLVMIDRRIVYTPNFAGVYWDTLDLPLEDIDRIEVIKGPGGTVWGANAVNGVISIFTKKAARTPGAMVTAGGGNLEQGFGTVQYGGGLGKNTDYRVYAKYQNQNHMLDLAGQNGADGWNQLRGGFRVDSALSARDSLTLEGDLYRGRERSGTMPTLTDQTPLCRCPSIATIAEIRWNRRPETPWILIFRTISRGANDRTLSGDWGTAIRTIGLEEA
jgi:iron complex outermembrane recepter protein